MALGLAADQNNPDVPVNTIVMKYLAKDCAGSSDVTLADSEANYAQLAFTGALTDNINVIVPDEAKVYDLYNGTTGSYTLTVKTLTGTGVVIQQGKRAIMGSNGTNIVRYVPDTYDSIIDGELVHDMGSDANYTLSTSTDPQEWQYETIEITDTGVVLTGPVDIIIPTNKKKYIVLNSTAQTLTFKVTGQTGEDVLTLKTAILRCDGTDMVRVTADY